MANPDAGPLDAEQQAALRNRRDQAERQMRILGDLLEVNPTVSLMIRYWFARRAFEHTSWLLEQADQQPCRQGRAESHAAAEHEPQHERHGDEVRDEGEGDDERLIRQRLLQSAGVPAGEVHARRTRGGIGR